MFRYSYILFLFLISSFTNAQNYSISMPNVSACNGDIVELSVDGNDLNNIGAITLFFNYNPDDFQFDTIENVNSLLGTIIFNDIQNATSTASIGKVGVSWSGFAAVNLSNNQLFTISFIFVGEASQIEFGNNCEIADFDANILNVNYTSSQINFSDTISIISQPQSVFNYTNGNIFN